jgi:hypothetical protein
LDNALCWPADRPQSFEEFQSRVNDLRREVKIRIIEKQSKVKALADLRRQVMEPLKPGEMVLVRRLTVNNRTRQIPYRDVTVSQPYMVEPYRDKRP